MFVLTPRAKRDLNDIWDQIADESPEAADRVSEHLERAMDLLAQSPGIGHWREELADKRHKFLLVHSYLIVYRFELKPVQVIRVLHAARDVQAILELESTRELQFLATAC